MLLKGAPTLQPFNPVNGRLNAGRAGNREWVEYIVPCQVIEMEGGHSIEKTKALLLPMFKNHD